MTIVIAHVRIIRIGNLNLVPFTIQFIQKLLQKMKHITEHKAEFIKGTIKA